MLLSKAHAYIGAKPKPGFEKIFSILRHQYEAGTRVFTGLVEVMQKAMTNPELIPNAEPGPLDPQEVYN